jgi:benzodiazapine receptor
MDELLSFLPFLGVVFAVALSGAVFMPGEWYKSLDKPSWTPPSWLFAPAWTVLYIMIAIAGWLVWKQDGLNLALAVWGANLVFNAAWSWLMFGRHSILGALWDAIAMLVTIVIFIALTLEPHFTASMLFLPYLAWTTFATALNFSIYLRSLSPAATNRTD